VADLKPTCTCHPVPEQYHTTHYGATEPGSTLEPDYDCLVHFPKPKRKWGNAPAHVFKTPAGCWHWRCLIGEPWHQTRCCRPTRKAAMEALTDHQGTQHACPDCGGSGGDRHLQDPEVGPCLRCGGHGVDLTASERSGA
jgi:hypothetical protein